MAYARIIKMNQLQTGHGMYIFGKLEHTRSVSFSCTVIGVWIFSNQTSCW